MTLTADQLEEIIDGTASDDPDVEMKAIDAARRDLAAMRQPITAEALTAAGWVEDYRTEQYGGVIVFRFESTDPNAPIRAWDVETGLDGSLKRIVDPRNFTVRSIRTMYALGQLVELLGGGK